MKRRTFLTASGTVGMVGAVSGTSVVTSVYSGISTQLLLEEFCPKTKKVLDKFATETALNVEAMGLDAKVAKRIFTPAKVISKKQDQITYKNKSGDYVSLSVVKGVERITIKKSL